MAVRPRMYEPAPRDPIFDRSWEPPKQRLTEAGIAFVRQNGRMPDEDARADALVSGDGLRQITTFDMSGRPTYEFHSVTGRKDWMNSFKAVPLMQTALTNNVENTRRQHQRFLNEHPDAIAM